MTAKISTVTHTQFPSHLRPTNVLAFSLFSCLGVINDNKHDFLALLNRLNLFLLFWSSSSSHPSSSTFARKSKDSQWKIGFLWSLKKDKQPHIRKQGFACDLKTVGECSLSFGQLISFFSTEFGNCDHSPYEWFILIFVDFVGCFPCDLVDHTCLLPLSPKTSFFSFTPCIAWTAVNINSICILIHLRMVVAKDVCVGVCCSESFIFILD